MPATRKNWNHYARMEYRCHLYIYSHSFRNIGCFSLRNSFGRSKRVLVLPCIDFSLSVHFHKHLICVLFWPYLINTRLELQFFELKNLMTYCCRHSDSRWFYYLLGLYDKEITLTLTYSYSLTLSYFHTSWTSFHFSNCVELLGIMELLAFNTSITTQTFYFHLIMLFLHLTDHAVQSWPFHDMQYQVNRVYLRKCFFFAYLNFLI